MYTKQECFHLRSYDHLSFRHMIKNRFIQSKYLIPRKKQFNNANQMPR